MSPSPSPSTWATLLGLLPSLVGLVRAIIGATGDAADDPQVALHVRRVKAESQIRAASIAAWLARKAVKAAK